MSIQVYATRCGSFVKSLSRLVRRGPKRYGVGLNSFDAPRQAKRYLLLTDHALAFYGNRPRLPDEEERRLLIRRAVSWALVALIHVVLLSLFILDQYRMSRFTLKPPVETILDLTKLPAGQAPPIRMIQPEVPTRRAAGDHHRAGDRRAAAQSGPGHAANARRHPEGDRRGALLRRGEFRESHPGRAHPLQARALDRAQVAQRHHRAGSGQLRRPSRHRPCPSCPAPTPCATRCRPRRLARSC